MPLHLGNGFSHEKKTRACFHPIIACSTCLVIVMQPVKDFSLVPESADEIVRGMAEGGGFSAKNLAVGVDILEKMMRDKQCLRFLSFTADIISTGTRGIIRDMVKEKLFDVVITTCGTWDHDLARSYTDYYHGSFFMDDARLRRQKVSRLGNVIVPDKSYGIIIEKKMSEFLKSMTKDKKEFSTHEISWEIGKKINNKSSILYWAYKNQIPVIVPGPTDGSVGYQLWQFSQDHDFAINLLKDEQLLSDLIWSAKKSGALIIGGGISKHHTIWWNQFKEGLDYAVYITTATEYDGSLSGAKTKEAVSWGKIKAQAKSVDIFCDATIALPLMFAALKERI